MNSFATIREYLRNKNQDVTFSPELLESLNENERISIETEIALYCQKGHIQYLKYIPYMRKISIESVLNSRVLAGFPEEVKMEALKNLFIKTKKDAYLKDITYSALQSVISFNSLINLSLDDRLTVEEQAVIKEIVNKVYKEKQDDLNYKIVVDFKLSYNDNISSYKK